MTRGSWFATLVILSLVGAWSLADAQTYSAQTRQIGANRDTVARVARDVLTAAGFTLADRPKAGTLGKARIAYANLPCEHVRSASGEWVLQIDLNPSRGSKDTTLMMVSYPETRAVREARRAEGVPTFESDCLQKHAQQLGDSIQAQALATLVPSRP